MAYKVVVQLVNSDGVVEADNVYQFDDESEAREAAFDAAIAADCHSSLQCDCADRSWYGSEHDTACPMYGVRAH